MTDVYPPSEDTYLLRDAALDEVDGDSVLEVGTGSGVVASELADVATSVVATDINPHAVREARRRGVEAVRTNLYDGVCAEFDVVVFNPPYLPTREERDDWMAEALDGGETGREVVSAFVDGVGRVLADGGRVLIVVSSLTGIDEVRERATEAGFAVDEVAEEKLFFERLVVLRLT